MNMEGAFIMYPYRMQMSLRYTLSCKILFHQCDLGHLRNASIIISFNPRTREGATVIYGNVVIPAACFNPRTREGATFNFGVHNGAGLVSIHAPVRVRLTSPSTCVATDWFQSTHP